MKFYKRSRITYLILFCILLCIELAIAVWVKDDFIRPYLGDFLVVILIYSFLRSISRIRVINALLIVLCFSFAVEFFQLVNIVKILQYQPPKVVMIILGSSFSAWDLLAYSLGILFTGFLELKIQSKEELAEN
ncbi:DUF2809 domain-containing protein [Christiangramia sp. SM2212]|uniref:DUF2809 domain-containing protein n=1 Tax=Christiangramia sediminicola TaxID=3073267 RepID=A0ABU1ERJ4_9FLAO|nr:DUF2809 domain-containing protein [Christiangramia sp. SM2212]MDR5591007.1 DUF2809 domain-containing protein [Christiangramia sp. SM2212]